jgi:hypothetical protein
MKKSPPKKWKMYNENKGCNKIFQNYQVDKTFQFIKYNWDLDLRLQTKPTKTLVAQVQRKLMLTICGQMLTMNKNFIEIQFSLHF